MRAHPPPPVPSVQQGRTQTLGHPSAHRVYQATTAQLALFQMILSSVHALLVFTAPHPPARWRARLVPFVHRVLQPPEPALMGSPALHPPELAHQEPTLGPIPWFTQWWEVWGCGLVFPVNLAAAMPHQPRTPCL